MNTIAISSHTTTLAARLRQVLSSPAFWLALLAVALFFGAINPEGPLDKLKQSISGPVAFVIALLGIIACGATLIWGGEVSEFTRRIIYVVLVVCVIVFANTLLTGAMFSGAVVPSDAQITASDLANAAIAGAGGK